MQIGKFFLVKIGIITLPEISQCKSGFKYTSSLLQFAVLSGAKREAEPNVKQNIFTLLQGNRVLKSLCLFLIRRVKWEKIDFSC